MSNIISNIERLRQLEKNTGVSGASNSDLLKSIRAEVAGLAQLVPSLSKVQGLANQPPHTSDKKDKLIVSERVSRLLSQLCPSSNPEQVPSFTR